VHHLYFTAYMLLESENHWRLLLLQFDHLLLFNAEGAQVLTLYTS